VHPNKFFQMVKVQNYNHMCGQELQLRLMDMQPLNFLNTQIVLPLYKISIKYKTQRGNSKQSERFILTNLPGGGKTGTEDCNRIIQNAVAEYGKSRFWVYSEITQISYFCDVVLSID